MFPERQEEGTPEGIGPGSRPNSDTGSEWLEGSGISQFETHFKKKKSMVCVQQCLVKKRKIAAARALTEEKSEPHQLQQAKQQWLAALLFLQLQKY